MRTNWQIPLQIVNICMKIVLLFYHEIKLNSRLC